METACLAVGGYRKKGLHCGGVMLGCFMVEGELVLQIVEHGRDFHQPTDMWGFGGSGLGKLVGAFIVAAEHK